MRSSRADGGRFGRLIGTTRATPPAVTPVAVVAGVGLRSADGRSVTLSAALASSDGGFGAAETGGAVTVARSERSTGGASAVSGAGGRGSTGLAADWAPDSGAEAAGFAVTAGDF